MTVIVLISGKIYYGCNSLHRKSMHEDGIGGGVVGQFGKMIYSGVFPDLPKSLGRIYMGNYGAYSMEMAHAKLIRSIPQRHGENI